MLRPISQGTQSQFNNGDHTQESIHFEQYMLTNDDGRGSQRVEFE